MENQTTTTRTALKWGFISGIITIVVSFITQLLKINQQPSVSASFLIFFIAMIFTCVILYLAMNDFKKENNGFLSFGQGLGLGTLTGAIWGLLSGAYNLFYVKFIDDSEIKKQIRMMREKMEEQNLPASQTEFQEKIIAFSTNPNVTFIMTVIIGLFSGLLLSLIIAAILKKDKSVFE